MTSESRRRRAAWAVVLGALCALPGGALDAGLRVSQYQKSYWAVEQGLPHTYVTAIAQSRDGFLWVGTDEGLARFDGLNFRAPVPAPSLRLGQAWISALLRASDGSLWVGTFEGRVAQLGAGGTERVYSTGGSVFALLEDASGRIWASSRNGVFRIAAGKLEKHTGLRAPLETSWNVLSAGAEGSIWIVDAAGLNLHRRGSTRLAAANGGRHGEVLTIQSGRSGTAWLGTSKGLYRMDRGEKLAAVDGVRGPVVSLLEDRDGTLWAGTWGHGVFRVAGGRAEQWSGSDGLPDDFIRTLAEDNEGNLWIGMRSGGLGRWQEPRIVPYGVAEGLSGNYASTVAVDPSGALWLGTWRGGFFKLREGKPEPHPTPLPVLYFTVRALTFDRLGHPWIGNWEGLFEFDGKRFVHHAAEPESPFRRVSVLLFDKKGGLWVGTTDRGLFRFQDGRPAGKPAVLLESAQITALMEDSSGRIWVGTSSGGGWFEGPAAERFERRPELGEDRIESLFEDSRRRVWATTAAGSLFAAGEKGTVQLDQRNGLPGHALYRAIEDDGGSLWVSSPRGILELRAGALEEVLSGRRKKLEIVRYGQEDGMRTIECHGLSQPAGGKSRDGSLWFPTARGFVQVRPARPRGFPPPLAQIEEARLESASLGLTPEVTIEAGARNLELAFTALRLTSPQKVEFRYRMEGYDPDWVEAGSERSARYNQLPAGRHVFQVQARDPAGEWGGAARVEVRQRPRFHQTFWFYMVLAVGAAGVLLGGYRWRLHSVRSRYAAVLEERNRIGREWHDTLVAGFSAISLQLEAAIARLVDQPARAADILEVTKKMVHHYRAEARRVIWDLRDNRPEGEVLPLALESALRRVTENRGIAGGVEVTGEPVELPLEMQHNVLRICQEAMSNAARHASPSRIDIRLAYGAKELKVSVADDGKGFDYRAAVAEATGHFGLVVMQERARRHSGRIEFTSGPGGGTTVETVIPVPAGSRK